MHDHTFDYSQYDFIRILKLNLVKLLAKYFNMIKELIMEGSLK
jgi:hypothetical protein